MRNDLLTVNIRQAKKSLSRLIKNACEGEEIIITRGSRPVVRLVSFAEVKKKRQPGSMKGQFTLGPEFFEPLPEDDLSAWEQADFDPLENKD